MFNLLPKEQQLNVSREYRLRLAGIALSFLVALSFVASVTLTPSLLLSYQIEGSDIKSADGLKNEVLAVTSDDPSGKLQLAKKKVALLSAENPSVYFYEMVNMIINDLTPGIKVSGVDIKVSDSSAHSITIIGLASNREALLLFARVLEKEKHFVSVVVPVSNFAPSANINFSIQVRTK